MKAKYPWSRVPAYKQEARVLRGNGWDRWCESGVPTRRWRGLEEGGFVPCSPQAGHRDEWHALCVCLGVLPGELVLGFHTLPGRVDLAVSSVQHHILVEAPLSIIRVLLLLLGEVRRQIPRLHKCAL